MSRSLPILVAALAAGAASFGKLLTDADANAIPVNVHVAHGQLAEFAADAAEFAQAVADAPAGADQTLVDRVAHLETVLTEAGYLTAPAPAPAAAPVEAPAPAAPVAPGPAL